jgi:hypothetical protein
LRNVHKNYEKQHKQPTNNKKTKQKQRKSAKKHPNIQKRTTIETLNHQQAINLKRQVWTAKPKNSTSKK